MATITEEYCSKEIYRLLIEKGFDGEVHTTFDKEGYTQPSITHQMAMKWLREMHNVFIYIEPFITTSGIQGYKPYCTKIGGEFMWINPLRKYSSTSSDAYEEAVEVAIKYALENLI